MGSSSSKLRKHLQSGDEVQALRLFRSDHEFWKALDPSCSYGDSHQHETPLHLAARNGMQTLLGIFLFSKGGNPNKTNSRKETALHCVCMENNSQSLFVCNRRAMCLNYLLKWRGAKLEEGQMEKIDLAAQDEKLNTALHYAAASGLTQCVEILIQVGAPLFIENEDNFTPCDTAERNGHASIALYLESKMVFSNDDELPAEEDNVSTPPVEEYTGLRPQDLQEAKDQLLVETADMLSVPLFTAEALLRNHEWSCETLLDAWMTDPVACCDKCGVTPPPSLFSEKPQVQENLASPVASSSLHSFHPSGASSEAECGICADLFQLSTEPVHMTCSHRFCKNCWERYLNLKIQEGDAHHITCPAYGCSMLVPVDIIEGIVSRDMALRYLQFDIKAFVDSNPDMKWCPAAGCGRAVKLPDLDGNGNRDGMGAAMDPSYRRGGSRRNKIPLDTSRGVDCGMGHYFCWECLEESHEPCSCENWTKWYQKISEVKPETLDGTEQETELAANCLWLVTNSKACPNCKSPIQKNEGCNHMKCSKCKYDFCWVCLEPWKRHNTSTGGYFKCNRFEVVKKVEEQNAQMVSEAETKNKHVQELNRFVHYYSRFKNHENSYKLEEPLLKTAKDKMMKLAEAATYNATANTETRFVEDAVQQLLKARRMLKCSYVYGFYLDGPGYKKIVFEFMQTELEECTEILSQMVNRLYLRTPRRRIVEQARAVQRKRLEFITAISKGLVPPETPPSSRKGKKKKPSKEASEDEDLRKAILASIQEVDPANPWIKDASGRHTNVTSLLEWPAEDSEDSDGEVETKEKRERIGKCHRVGCNKVRATNPKTNEIHDYCSMWCQLIAQEDDHKEDREGISEIMLDEHMELLRALEMSRLQYLQDSGLLHVPRASQDLESPDHGAAVRNSRRQQARNRSSSVDRQDAGASGQREGGAGISSMEELGIELQRFQELSSSAFPSRGATHCADLFGSQSEGLEAKSAWEPGQRQDEVRSTIVPRVPNKSVEDLHGLSQPQASVEAGDDDVAFARAGFSSPATVRAALGSFASTSDEGEKSQTAAASSSCLGSAGLPFETAGPGSPALLDSPSSSSCGRAERTGDTGGSSNKSSLNLFGSMFGAIKDVSVSNIHAKESDKTKEFLTKDLAAIFSGWDLEAFNDADKSSTASALVAASSRAGVSPSSSSEDLSLVPLPELHVASGFDSADRVKSSNPAPVSAESGYGKRPSTLNTTGRAPSGACGRDGLAAQNSDGAKHIPKESTAALSKGKGKSLTQSSCARKDNTGGKKSSTNWAEQRSREKHCLPSPPDEFDDTQQTLSFHKEAQPTRRSQAQPSALEQWKYPVFVFKKEDTADNATLLRMAENLLQMTADVHSRMQDSGGGVRDFPGDVGGMSGKTEFKEAREKRDGEKVVKHSTRSGSRDSSKHIRRCSSTHKLLGKDKETRILYQLPKHSWSSEGEENSDGEKLNSFGELPDPFQWAPDSLRYSSSASSFPSQHCSPRTIFSGSKKVGGMGDFEDKKPVVNEKGDGSTKSTRKKSSSKSSKKGKHKAQAVAVFTDEAGHSHAVSTSSPRTKTKDCWSRTSQRRGDDLLPGETALVRSEANTRSRNTAHVPSFESDNLSSINAHARELKEDKYADIVRESASSMFPLFPSPPPPAPPSPNYQSKPNQSQAQDSKRPSMRDPAADPAAPPTTLSNPQNVIKYCLRRNIYSGEVQLMEVNESGDVGQAEAYVPPAGGATLDGSSDDPLAATSALTAFDHYETAASDVENWEDATAVPPREERLDPIKTNSEVGPEGGSEAEDLGSIYV